MSETTELEVIDAGGGALEQISRAEIDTQIATAKKYPRSLSKVRDNVLTLATMDEETAAACFFSLPRGGKDITGESVRLAEILASAYGNLRAAWRPVAIDRQNGTVTCQGICHDLENNVSTSVEKTRKVQKKRNAATFDEDMIMLAQNACGAIAYRDAIFKVVPKALIKPILKDIKEAARGKGTLDQKVDRVMKRLIEMGEAAGVKEKDMEKRVLAAVECGKRSDIDLTKLDVLIGMGTAIRDGEVRLSDAFPDPKEAAAKEKNPFKPEAKDEKPENTSTETETEAPTDEPAAEASAEPDEGKTEEAASSGGEPGDPDDLANLMMDVDGLGDARMRKSAIALGILPKDYSGSVMEASPEQVGAMIRRFDEIVNLKVK